MATRSRSLILVPAIIGACLFVGTLQVVGVAVSGPPQLAGGMVVPAPRADRDADPGPGADDGTIDAGLIQIPSASANAISL